MTSSSSATKDELLIAIRKHCLDCCGNSHNQVRACKSYSCALYTYRMKDAPPAPARKGEKQKVQLSFDDIAGGDTN